MYGYSDLSIIIRGLIVGIVLEMSTNGLVSYIVGKCAGMHVFSFKYLFFSYTRENGLHLGGFMPICDLMMTKEDLTDEEDKRYYVHKTAVNAFIAAMILIITVYLWMTRALSERMLFFISGMTAWWVISSTGRIILGVRFLGKADKMLFRKTKLLAQRFINGEALENVDIPDYRTLGCIATSGEIVMYQCYVFMKMVWMDDLVGLPEVVRSFEENMRLDYKSKPSGFLISQTPAYYNLLYYYSAISPDRDKAEFIYSIIGTDLKRDKDANGLRVLAYYTYYIMRNEKKAYDLLSEAIEALPLMKYRAERLLEDKLINRLIPIVNERIEMNYPNG